MRYFISKASALIRRRQLKAMRAIYLKKSRPIDQIIVTVAFITALMFPLLFPCPSPSFSARPCAPRSDPPITRGPWPSGL